MSNRQKKEYEMDLFLSSIQRIQNNILDFDHLGISIENLQKKSTTMDLLQSFPGQFLKESMNMTDCFQILYCFENDLRKVIGDVMNECVGLDWWEKCISQKIKDDVKRNQTVEWNSLYYGRQIDNPLYFTTLGDLKEIITSNYEYFENHFRTEHFVNELLYQINRLRVVVGHNCILDDMDIQTLKQHVERWYTTK